MKPIRYSIVPVHPEAHLFEVSCIVDEPEPAGQVFAMPAWIPGSYMIREFAKNIVEIRAETGGQPVALTKLDKDRWQAAPCSDRLTLIYSVYAWDLSVRCAHLDTLHGFFNGTAVFLRVVGCEEMQHVVDIRKPAGPSYASWRVATSLAELKAKRFGFGTYAASNYDELVDHPVALGDFTLAQFDACGVGHDVAISGRVPKLDSDRLCSDLKTLCEAQIRFFEPRSKQAPASSEQGSRLRDANVREFGGAPFERYVFLVTATGEGYGGLEHRASSALLCSRFDLPVLGKPDSGDGYRNFLGLASHEYFHAWNVKRIKPAAFAPYNFQTENHTRLLWIFEGFTSYYDDLFLVRTRLVSIEQYLKRLEKTISTVLRGSGRDKQSVAESSFDAWTKYYRQDENSPNAIVSYYQKGSLVALALDLAIRVESGGRKSLDDAMRALWKRYGRDFYPGNSAGLGEDEFARVVEDATGVDVSAQVASWAGGTADPPLAELLSEFGIDLNLKPENERASLGIKLAGKSVNGECRIAMVYDGGAAQVGGLSAGDVLLAIDGVRVAANLDTLLGRYAAGDRVHIHAFRRDELIDFEVALGAEPPVKCTLSRRYEENALRRAWLKRKS